MTRQGIALLLTLPVLAACSQRGPTAPDASIGVAAGGAGLAAKADGGRPFSGRCDTVISIAAPRPGDRPPPEFVRLHIEYVCQLSHLGRTTAINEQTVTMTGPQSATSENSTTYTAANGDRLFATWSGEATFSGTDASDIAFRGTEIYGGGTGRFADASGSSFIDGNGSLATRRAHFTLSGTLSY